MKQAIIILLKRDKEIEKIRKKYVPHYKKFKPHISLIYTLEVNNQKQLSKHIKNSIKGMKPFHLTLKDLKKSTNEYYLYLLIGKGKDKIMKIYKKLNSGVLSKFKNKNMPCYIPHISIGVFKTKKEINEAIKKLKKHNLKMKTEIKSIQLITLKKDHSIKNIKNFRL